MNLEALIAKLEAETAALLTATIAAARVHEGRPILALRLGVVQVGDAAADAAWSRSDAIPSLPTWGWTETPIRGVRVAGATLSAAHAAELGCPAELLAVSS